MEFPMFAIVLFHLNEINFCVSFQSDREKEEGLPVAPFMDREKVTKPTAQIGFIKFVLIPMFETVASVSKTQTGEKCYKCKE